jgi:phosphopantothenoylcysteine decarboxylase/phosphopantothenate--cysteine ligase
MATLKARGVAVVEPEEGAMACGEWGPGRLAEPPAILASIMAMLGAAPQLLSGNTLTGRHILVTSGPTHEPIDPVRYIANRSSGRQGHAISAALAALGARVTLVSGPVAIPPPAGVKTVPVETAEQMLAACRAALPAEAAVCVAAVADWRVGSPRTHKIKKVAGREAPSLELIANPDILATLSAPGEARPRLVVGFAAETDDVMANATEKRRRKGCDWLVANDVSEAGGAMGGLENEVHLITAEGVEDWPRMAKEAVAARLAARIAEALA